MRELSINYPKGPEDEQKIHHWLTRYKQEQEPQVIQEIQDEVFGDLDI